MRRIGIDLGGTKIEGVLLDDEFKILSRKRIPTPRDDYNGVILSIKSLVDDLGDCDRIGVCIPGVLTGTGGSVRNSNTLCLNGRHMLEDLKAALNRTPRMENDANCFALAEARMGAAAGCGTVFGVIMGTGVGGGIVVNGSIHHGPNGLAGEWGHHRLYENGNECYCGRSGCVETYLSGPALERRWTEITGRSTPLSHIVRETGEAARSWKAEFLANFGLGLANVINILDPDIVVLGGGVSNVEFLYDEGRRAVTERTFGHVKTPIVRNSLGDSAGVFGACLI